MYLLFFFEIASFKGRNKPYVPSDDEEEDSMDENTPISIRKNQQLPSDDEEDEGS